MVTYVRARAGRAVADLTGLQELFNPGIRNNVRDAAQSIGKAMHAQAVKDAPMHLPQARHPRYYQVYRLSDVNAYTVRTSTAYMRTYATISCKADHFLFVHEGTSGPIVGRGRFRVRGVPHMMIPAGAWSPTGPRPVRFVRGQRANPYMARAMQYVMLRKGYL